MNLSRESFAGCAERFLTWLGAVEEGAVYRLPLPRGHAECIVHSDRVTCRADGRTLDFAAAGTGANGVLPAMKAIGDLALVCVPFHVAVASDPASAGHRNTALTYQFQEDAHRTTVCTVVFAGAPAAGELEVLVASLTAGDNFVPGQVGLSDLQDPDCSPPGMTWHEVLAVRLTDEAPTDGRTFSRFVDDVAGHVLVHGWDEDHVPTQAERTAERRDVRPVAA